MNWLRESSSGLFDGSIFILLQSTLRLLRLFLIFFRLEIKAKSISLNKLFLIAKLEVIFCFGSNLIKLEFTFGLISKASGGTSNNIWLSKNAAIFIANLPQSLYQLHQRFFQPLPFELKSACQWYSLRYQLTLRWFELKYYREGYQQLFV